jgi:hypothetical protein
MIHSQFPPEEEAFLHSARREFSPAALSDCLLFVGRKSSNQGWLRCPSARNSNAASNSTHQDKVCIGGRECGQSTQF